jgi:hypothetical protein
MYGGNQGDKLAHKRVVNHLKIAVLKIAKRRSGKGHLDN